MQANERRLRAELDNVISREQGVWYHRLQVQVQMEQGVLDSLTFELPEAWTAGLPEDAGLRITYAQASQPGMVRVTFQPQQQPFNPTSPILFSGPIPVSPGQPLTVPNIRLLDEGQIVRRLFLPVSLEDQAIVWSTSGLEPLEDVEVPAAMTQPNATYQAYRIPDGQFQATRLAAKSAVGAPTISLVDVHIAWREAARFQGLAMFDLLAGRSGRMPGAVSRRPPTDRPLRRRIARSPAGGHRASRRTGPASKGQTRLQRTPAARAGGV